MIFFGAVELTKVVKNGGEWSIAWNRTVRAIIFAFPHRLKEFTTYGEYIINLFSVTHPSVHSRVIAFDKAVRKRIGSVRNLKLSDFEKFADLKIAPEISKEDVQKGNRDENCKKKEPCNKWNDRKCDRAEEDCTGNRDMSVTSVKREDTTEGSALSAERPHLILKRLQHSPSRSCHPLFFVVVG